MDFFYKGNMTQIELLKVLKVLHERIMLRRTVKSDGKGNEWYSYDMRTEDWDVLVVCISELLKTIKE